MKKPLIAILSLAAVVGVCLEVVSIPVSFVSLTATQVDGPQVGRVVEIRLDEPAIVPWLAAYTTRLEGHVSIGGIDQQIQMQWRIGAPSFQMVLPEGETITLMSYTCDFDMDGDVDQTDFGIWQCSQNRPTLEEFLEQMTGAR